MNNAKRNNKFAFMRIRTRCVDRACRHQLLFPLRASFGFVQVIYQKAFDTVYIVYYIRGIRHMKRIRVKPSPSNYINLMLLPTLARQHLNPAMRLFVERARVISNG